MPLKVLFYTHTLCNTWCPKNIFTSPKRKSYYPIALYRIEWNTIPPICVLCKPNFQ